MKIENVADKRYPYISEDMPERVKTLLLRQAFISGYNYAQQEREWVSVDERLPELPKPYHDEGLDTMVRRVTISVIAYDGECVYETSVGEEGFTDKSITHWQPLPEKPKFPKQK